MRCGNMLILGDNVIGRRVHLELPGCVCALEFVGMNGKLMETRVYAAVVDDETTKILYYSTPHLFKGLLKDYKVVLEEPEPLDVVNIFRTGRSAYSNVVVATKDGIKFKLNNSGEVSDYILGKKCVHIFCDTIDKCGKKTVSKSGLCEGEPIDGHCDELHWTGNKLFICDGVTQPLYQKLEGNRITLDHKIDGVNLHTLVGKHVATVLSGNTLYIYDILYKREVASVNVVPGEWKSPLMYLMGDWYLLGADDVLYDAHNECGSLLGWNPKPNGELGELHGLRATLPIRSKGAQMS